MKLKEIDLCALLQKHDSSCIVLAPGRWIPDLMYIDQITAILLDGLRSKEPFKISACGTPFYKIDWKNAPRDVVNLLCRRGIMLFDPPTGLTSKLSMYEDTRVVGVYTK